MARSAILRAQSVRLADAFHGLRRGQMPGRSSCVSKRLDMCEFVNTVQVRDFVTGVFQLESENVLSSFHLGYEGWPTFARFARLFRTSRFASLTRYRQ